MTTIADFSREDGLPPPGERLEVMLALALDPPPPEGRCPSLEDIAGWHDRTLPQSRVSHVRAHVARCRDCYSAWYALLECSQPRAAAEAETSPARGARTALTRLSARFRLWGPIAAGLAAAAAAAVYVFPAGSASWLRNIDGGYESLARVVAQSAPSAARWTWGHGLGVRNVEDPWERLATLQASYEHEAAVSAFGAGARAGLRASVGDAPDWEPILAALPAAPHPCDSAAAPDVCEKVSTTFEGVGRWAVLLHFACALDPANARSSPHAAFWRDQAGVLDQAARAIDASVAGSPFDRFFSDWQAEAQRGDDPRAVLCAREASLLSLGLD